MCVLNKNSEVRKYKYHVESPATDKDLVESLEFISGPQTHGGVIDRSLKLRVDKISVYGKVIFLHMCVYTYILYSHCYEKASGSYMFM